MAKRHSARLQGAGRVGVRTVGDAAGGERAPGAEVSELGACQSFVFSEDGACCVMCEVCKLEMQASLWKTLGRRGGVQSGRPQRFCVSAVCGCAGARARQAGADGARSGACLSEGCGGVNAHSSSRYLHSSYHSHT